MIILLLLGQSLNEQRLIRIEDRINALETRVARIEERLNGIEKRINDLDKKLNKRMDDLITYLWIFMGFITILIGFIIGFGLWDRRTYLKPLEEKKADKELVMKLEQKIENLEDENKRLKNQNQALIFILEKFISGASKKKLNLRLK